MKSINLNQKIGVSSIVTRSSLQNVFNSLENVKDDVLVFDFKDINFISRSAADEYLKFKNNSQKKIIQKNCSESIKIMLKIVEDSEPKISYKISTDKFKHIQVI